MSRQAGFLPGLPAGILVTQPGHAIHASAGPPGAEARPAAPAGANGPGQPGGMRHQLDLAVLAGNRDHRPDPAARQRKPLPRPVACRLAAWNGTHSPIFPEPDALRATADVGLALTFVVVAQDGPHARDDGGRGE